jgi:hypothetical protein
VEVCNVSRTEDGSGVRFVEVCDDDGGRARVYDAGAETWRCDMCGRRLRGGVRVCGRVSGGRIDICEACVRAYAHAPAKHLSEAWRTRFGEGLATAERVVAQVDDLVSIYPRWRLLARRRIRRQVFATRRNLHAYTQSLAEADGQESIAEMIESFKQFAAIIDTYFRDPDASPLGGEFPRSLRPRERELLEFLLSADTPAAEALRVQAQSARATAYCGCGCPSIYLEVDRGRAPRAKISSGPAVETCNDPGDPDDTLWLLLWTEDGWLSYLEIAWVADEPPEELPCAEGLVPPYVGGPPVTGRE